MKLLLVATLLACTCGVLGDGLIPKIVLPDAVQKLIPAPFLLPLDALNKGLDTLNGYLDVGKWKDVLSSSGAAGKDVFNLTIELVKLFQSGDFTNPFAIADLANNAYNTIGKIQVAIKNVKDIPLYIPFLNSLETTLDNMKGNLKVIRCIRPANCLSGVFGGLFGRR